MGEESVEGWNEYITYGGIPIVVLANTDDQKMALLNNLFKETYIRNVALRNNIKNVFDFLLQPESLEL